MADKEIGLFQIRYGKQRDLPTFLEQAELAITTDECRMFCGLPASTTPASLVAGRRKNNTSGGNNFTVQGSGEENVEILTEFTPQHVLDRVLAKPKREVIPANSDIILRVPSTNRLFLEYVSFPSDLSILESGSAQIVTIGTSTLLSQQNNTNDNDSDPKVEVGTIELNNAFVLVQIKNTSTVDYNFEYTSRGWGNQ